MQLQGFILDMPLELSSLNAEAMLNDVVDDDGSWDLSWELDGELLDLLDDNASPEQHNEHNMMMEQHLDIMQDDAFDWSAFDEELPRMEPANLPSEERADGRELAEHLEEQLAKLDGEHESLTATPPTAPLPMAWNILGSMSSRATILVLRLCFARHRDNEYKIYDAIDNIGYHYLGMPLLLKVTELQTGQQLANEYMHLFEYSELPDHVKQLILLESGEDVPRLLHRSDGSHCHLDGAIMCAARPERVDIVLKSRIASALESHSGFNVFGEPTQISLTIHSKEIVLANATLVQLISKPDIDIFFVANTNNIYILNGRSLLESTDLANHVLPIKNIDLIVYSPRQFAL